MADRNRGGGQDGGQERQSRLVLGVDPGEQGAAALIRCGMGCDRPELLELRDTDDRRRLRDMAKRADLIVVEGQQASPQMGRSSAFKLGMAYGGVLEALEAFQSGGVVGVAVTWPAAWRGSYGLAGGVSGKRAGVKLAKELLGEWGRQVERHDQADAVLLAWWGWRHRLLARVAQELQAAPGG